MTWRENLSRSKEVLGAYFRQGMHELGAALYGPGTIAQHAELGMLATRTPAQVTEGLRGGPEPEHSADNAQPSSLDRHLEQAREREPQAPEPERDGPDLERG